MTTAEGVEAMTNVLMLTETAVQLVAVGGYPDAPADLAENQLLVGCRAGRFRITVEEESTDG